MKDAQRYLAAEQKLFAHAGISPVERTITLARIGGLARVLDTGQGEPVLFLAGGPNVAASFALLVAELPGLRCLLVDRPGTGLSAPPAVVPNAQRLPGYLVDLVADVLDGLSLERAHLVGSSLGGCAAIRAAVALPQRVDRVVLLGCPAFVPGWKQPSFFTLLRTPVLGELLLRLPVRRSDALRFLREMGSKQSLSGGRIPISS